MGPVRGGVQLYVYAIVVLFVPCGYKMVECGGLYTHRVRGLYSLYRVHRNGTNPSTCSTYLYGAHLASLLLGSTPTTLRSASWIPGPVAARLGW